MFVTFIFSCITFLYRVTSMCRLTVLSQHKQYVVFLRKDRPFLRHHFSLVAEFIYRHSWIITFLGRHNSCIASHSCINVSHSFSQTALFICIYRLLQTAKFMYRLCQAANFRYRLSQKALFMYYLSLQSNIIVSSFRSQSA